MNNYRKYAAGGQVPTGMSQRQYASIYTQGRDPFFKEGGTLKYQDGGEAEAERPRYSPTVQGSGEGLPQNPYSDRVNPYFSNDATQGYRIDDRDLAIYRGPYRNMNEALAAKAKQKALNTNDLGPQTQLVHGNKYLIDELRKRNKGWDNFESDVANIVDPARGNPERYKQVTDSLAGVYRNTLNDAEVDSVLQANMDPANYQKAMEQYKSRQGRFEGTGSEARNYGSRTALGDFGTTNIMLSNRDMGTKRIASTMPSGRNITHAVVGVPVTGTDLYPSVQQYYRDNNINYPYRSTSKSYYDLRPVKVRQ